MQPLRYLLKDSLMNTTTLLRFLTITPLLLSPGYTAGADAIYVLSGLTANSMLTFPADLYSINLADGKVNSATSLSTDIYMRGVHFILPDYERRIIVLGRPKFRPDHLLVIKMDSPASVAHVNIANLYREGDNAAYECLVETPDRGLEMAVGVSGVKGEDFRLVAALLNDRGESARAPDEDLRYIRTAGYFGTAFHYPRPPYVRDDLGPDLNLMLWGRGLDLGVPNPPDRMKRAGGRYVPVLEVKNDAAIVVTSGGDSVHAPEGLGSSTHYIYSLSKKKWARVVVPGSSSKVRSFGRWLAFAVSETQPWAYSPDGRPVTADPERQRISPGGTERETNMFKGRTSDAGRQHPGPAFDTLRESEDWFPGILLLYDVETGRLLRLETGQGDSEIVLVDGLDVYYRASMTLYHTRIDEAGLETPTQVGSDQAIGNVHWAFIPNKPVR